MINKILSVSKEVQNGRNLRTVMNALIEETEEVDEEVDIALEMLDGPHGEDGVFGEAIDVMLCAIDLMYVDNPNITPEAIEAYAMKKLKKWKDQEAINGTR